MKKLVPLFLLLIIAPLANAQTKKLYVKKNGFCGDWFKSKHPNGAALIILGGSEGGNSFGDRWGPILNKKGYDALAVSYFKDKGLPKKLELIPLEYVGRALHWIEKNTNDNKIGIVGVSKGSELTLVEASLHPQFDAVVALAPSSVVWQAINKKNPFSRKSSWTLNGKPLPFLPYDYSKGYHGFSSIYNFYNGALNHIEDYKKAIIKVENIQAPILLISGSNDQLWPSKRMAGMIVNRLKKHSFNYRVANITIPNAGHEVFTPEVNKSNVKKFLSRFGKELVKLGGSKKYFLEHMNISKKHVYKFLNKYLSTVI